MDISYTKLNGKKSISVSKKILIDTDEISKEGISIYKSKKVISDSVSEDSINEDCMKEDESEDELEKELEKKINLPKNFGNKWTDKDKKKLLSYLSNSKTKINFESDDPLIMKMAKKFSRSVGGIKAEIRRIIFEKYINGQDVKNISLELNIIYRDIKQMIKLHLEKEADNEINILEKENKLLKLRIENINLLKELNEIKKI